MTELLGIITLITGLNNNSLSAGKSAVQHNNNLASLNAKEQNTINQIDTRAQKAKLTFPFLDNVNNKSLSQKFVAFWARLEGDLGP